MKFTINPFTGLLDATGKNGGSGEGGVKTINGQSGDVTLTADAPLSWNGTALTNNQKIPYKLKATTQPISGGDPVVRTGEVTNNELEFYGQFGIDIDVSENRVIISPAEIAQPFSWAAVTSAESVNVENNKGYIIKTNAQATLSLPQKCSVGFFFKVMTTGQGSWQIHQHNGQTIQYKDQTTSEGTEGSITGSRTTDAEIICYEQDFKFKVFLNDGSIQVQ